MTAITLSTAAALGAKADVLTVGLFQTDADVEATSSEYAAVAAAAQIAGASGKLEEIASFPAPATCTARRIIAVGLGRADALTPDRIRRAAGAASRAAAGAQRLVSTLATLDLRAAAEGHLLGAYQFTGYQTPAKPGVKAVVLHVPKNDKSARETLRSAVIGCEAVCLARDLVNTAPNDLPPAVFADRVAAAARTAGISAQVMTERALERGGYGGILGVGSGSTRPPRLVRLSYRPSRPRAHVALVGKGVTFDSGGISLKPPAGMDHMTSDMAGAAAVVAATIGAAALALPIAVTATVPMVENLPSGSAYRPGDVLTHRGGKTVHVLNTDAEGRLILADAIVRACEDKPDFLITAATLTGAQVVALGNRTMGVMGTDDFRDRVAQLGRDAGEGAWAMPLPEELGEALHSTLADIANVSADRAGGMLVAGHYLKAFVGDGVPWAHLDVAGPAYLTSSAFGYTVPGGTGVPVRTLLATLVDLATR